jgi:CRP/FNR family transcriptional regulator
MHNAAIPHCAACTLLVICQSRGFTDRGCPARPLKIGHGQLARGEALYHAGEDGSAIYALRSGCVKDVITRQDGSESVVGIALPGEMVGLGYLPAGAARTTAIAVSSTEFCRITWSAFQQLASEVPQAGDELVRWMSAALTAAGEYAVSVLEKDALGRIAGLLVDFSSRLRRGGLDGQNFRLSLARADIASYLGLTVETVSRGLSELHDRSLVEVRGKVLRLLARAELERLAGLA